MSIYKFKDELKQALADAGFESSEIDSGLNAKREFHTIKLIRRIHPGQLDKIESYVRLVAENKHSHDLFWGRYEFPDNIELKEDRMIIYISIWRSS